ncbi:hypothetical protein D1007_57878 [Hordeum vulgare]|nr:hypothetical protein D1007_57878 [Hordeum vulgare]
MTLATRPKNHQKRLDGLVVGREGEARWCGTKMTGKFKDILSEKDEACVKCSDLGEEKKVKRFNLLMKAMEKKLKVEERRSMMKKIKVVLEEKKLKVTTNA